MEQHQPIVDFVDQQLPEVSSGASPASASATAEPRVFPSSGSLVVNKMVSFMKEQIDSCKDLPNGVASFLNAQVDRFSRKTSSFQKKQKKRYIIFDDDDTAEPLETDDVVSSEIPEAENAIPHEDSALVDPVVSASEPIADDPPPDSPIQSPVLDQFYDWLGGDAPTPEQNRVESPVVSVHPQAVHDFAPQFGPARAPPPVRITRSAAKSQNIQIPENLTPPDKPLEYQKPTAEVSSDQSNHVPGVSSGDPANVSEVSSADPANFANRVFSVSAPDVEPSALIFWANSEELLTPEESRRLFMCPIEADAFLTAKQMKANSEVKQNIALSENNFWKAMEAEIDELIINGMTFDYPPAGVFPYSSRWVFTRKDNPLGCKSRIVARGYEEKWYTTDDPATDSPTLQRESLRLICHYAAHAKYDLQEWDVKTAFQQADTSFDPENSENFGLWIKPPQHFPSKYQLKPGQCLKIPSNKTLYGMASAPRRFYFFIRQLLIDHGFQISKFDECVFFLRTNNKLRGVVGFHVDDGLLAGDSYFYDIMNKLAKKIKFGTRKHTNFKFCGIRIQQHKNYAVELDQEESLEMIEEIKIDKIVQTMIESVKRKQLKCEAD